MIDHVDESIDIDKISEETHESLQDDLALGQAKKSIFLKIQPSRNPKLTGGASTPQ